MSHLIIDGIDTVYTPAGEYEKTWHGLQTVVPKIETHGLNIPDVFCPIVQCGFKPDFNADISNVPEDLASEMGANPMKDWKIILADCREGKAKKVFPIHIAGEGYQIHDNRLLFDTMVKAIEKVLNNAFEIATVGTLGAYSQFFVSIALKGSNESFTVGANDLHKLYFNLISSHNGLVSSQRMLSIIRMVCMNTVQMSIADSEATGATSAIRHSRNSLELITPEIFEKDLATWISAKERHHALLDSLRGQSMSLDGFRSFATGIFTRPDSDELSTCSFNRIGDLESLFGKGGQGNKGETRYDALNAFTEFFTSGNGVGNSKNVRAGKRIASANFGRGNEWKLEAMRVLGDEKEFAIVCQRGEILYTDKVKVEATSN